ncbi:hypothetical protein [Serratia marcescens]|uniref:hypothetical protein n=1 Tax=Serratia marcescens TaxID=615 RepID=UPI00148B6BA7|nr:hypothetical protein [Serratia marcescens]
MGIDIEPAAHRRLQQRIGDQQQRGQRRPVDRPAAIAIGDLRLAEQPAQFGAAQRLAVDSFRAHYLAVQLAQGGVRRRAERAVFVAGDRGGQRLLQQTFGQGVDRHRFGGGPVFQGGDQGFRKA